MAQLSRFNKLQPTNLSTNEKSTPVNLTVSKATRVENQFLLYQVSIEHCSKTWDTTLKQH